MITRLGMFLLRSFTYRVCVSSLAVVLVFAALSSRGSAHEVIPSIVDFEVVDDRLVVSLQGSLEAFIAEVNLSDFTDVNLSPQAQRYDELRQLTASELAIEFESYWPNFSDLFQVVAEQSPLVLDLTDIQVPPDTPMELTRISTITMVSELASGVSEIEIVTTRAIGGFVIRQNSVGTPFSGYIEGGMRSPAIDLQRVSRWDSFLDFLGFR